MTTVIGFAGYSGSGKTTLIARLIPWFEAGGVRVAVIKHDAHGHYKEAIGADSSQWIESGASAVAVVSPNAVHRYERVAMSLQETIDQWAGRFDLIIVEGFKGERHPKIAVFRSKAQADIVHHLPGKAVAWVASDAKLAGLAAKDVPVYDPDDVEGIANFITGFMNGTDNGNQ